jgi:AraC family transcriptional regulator of arabinose operon
LKDLNRTADLGAGQAGIVLAGHFDEPDTYVTKRPAGMNDWLITFTLGGAGYYLTPGGKSICSAGDIALLKPGTPHQYGTEPGSRWHFVWAHFSSPLMETGLLPDRELLLHRIEGATARERIYQAFKRIIADASERGAYWRELSENALREVLLLLAGKIGKKNDPRIDETLHYLSEHMHEPISIEQLAKAVGLSPSRLSHLFKKQTGQSIVETLNRMRLRQAALLLEHTDRSASEAARDAGFQNYNHFLNLFRKTYGVSPSVYRKEKSQSL